MGTWGIGGSKGKSQLPKEVWGKSIESQKRKSGRRQNKLQERVKGLQSLVPTAKVKYCNMPKAPEIKRLKHVTFIVVFSRKQTETRMRICGNH